MSDSVSNFIEPNNDLIFTSPVQLDSEAHNIIKITPYTGSTFGPNSNIAFKHNSTNEFIDFKRSYLRGTFTATLGAGTAGTLAVSKLGVGALFKNVRDTVNGQLLNTNTDWNITHIPENLLATSERKDILKITELYDQFTSGSALTSGYNFAIPIPSQLASSQRYFPLAICSGGLEMEWTLESAANVFAIGAASDSTYTLSNVELVLCMVRPSNSYLNTLSNAISRGAALKFPIEIKKTISMPLSTASTQTIKLFTGRIESLNSISLFPVDKDFIDAPTADKFVGSSKLQSNVDSYYFNINSELYPRNTKYYVKSKRAEHLLTLLQGLNVEYGGLGLPGSTTVSTSDFGYVNFKSNGAWHSGIVVPNGFIDLTIDASTTFDSTDILYVVLAYDGMLEISASSCEIYS